MQKLVMMTALGCLAMATAADAQVLGAGASHCGYGAGDTDTVLELARLELSRESALSLA